MEQFCQFQEASFNERIFNRIIQMNYNSHSYYPHHNPLEARVKQLQADKQQLSTAIEELNLCYQEKISLLEATIAHQQQRCQELLQWKQNYINRGLFEVEKYENEIKKMIEILDNAHRQFEAKQNELQREINDYRLEIHELKEENEALSQFNSQNQAKIEEMVRTYTEQIDKLKQELKLLREQSVFSEDSSMALRDISSRNNLENIAPNQKVPFATEVDPSFSKFSVVTGNE